MGKTIAIIHTTALTVEPLKKLAGIYLPNYNVINFMDDSILPQLIENGGKVEEVEERLIQYTKFAEQAGASIILNACSSVGGVVKKVREHLNIPIVRIDEAMGEEAIKRGGKIGVIATLSTTLNPTVRLLQEKAGTSNKPVEIRSVLVGEAYERLLYGDSMGHDSILAERLSELVDEVDVVVLAQASMARVVSTLPVNQQEKFLTSPELGMARVKQLLEG